MHGTSCVHSDHLFILTVLSPKKRHDTGLIALPLVPRSLLPICPDFSFLCAVFLFLSFVLSLIVWVAVCLTKSWIKEILAEKQKTDIGGDGEKV